METNSLNFFMKLYKELTASGLDQGSEYHSVQWFDYAGAGLCYPLDDDESG